MTTLIHLNSTHLPDLPPLAMAIGNFDGVHVGHQAMIKQCKNIALKQGYQTAVMVFEPQPKEFFDPLSAPARLTNLSEKHAKLAKLLVDYVLVAKFDTQFRLLSAQEFCTILHTLNAKTLIIGDDFRFGHDRMGDGAYLSEFGFDVHTIATVLCDGTKVSSTAIRNSLACADFTQANKLLGEPYTITGGVIHGDKIGRKLGFATANIALDRLKPALLGIYGVEVVADTPWDMLGTDGLVGRRPNSLFGAANIGTRPSVKGEEFRLEVHFPTFVGDLYGRMLTVHFDYFLHQEKHYSTLDELKKGIHQDIEDLVAWHKASQARHLHSTTK